MYKREVVDEDRLQLDEADARIYLLVSRRAEELRSVAIRLWRLWISPLGVMPVDEALEITQSTARRQRALICESRDARTRPSEHRIFKEGPLRPSTAAVWKGLVMSVASREQ